MSHERANGLDKRPSLILDVFLALRGIRRVLLGNDNPDKKEPSRTEESIQRPKLRVLEPSVASTGQSQRSPPSPPQRIYQHHQQNLTKYESQDRFRSNYEDSFQFLSLLYDFKSNQYYDEQQIKYDDVKTEQDQKIQSNAQVSYLNQMTSFKREKSRDKVISDTSLTEQSDSEPFIPTSKMAKRSTSSTPAELVSQMKQTSSISKHGNKYAKLNKLKVHCSESILYLDLTSDTETDRLSPVLLSVLLQRKIESERSNIAHSSDVLHRDAFSSSSEHEAEILKNEKTPESAKVITHEKSPIRISKKTSRSRIPFGEKQSPTIKSKGSTLHSSSSPFSKLRIKSKLGKSGSPENSTSSAGVSSEQVQKKSDDLQSELNLQRAYAVNVQGKPGSQGSSSKVSSTANYIKHLQANSPVPSLNEDRLTSKEYLQLNGDSGFSRPQAVSLQFGASGTSQASKSPWVNEVQCNVPESNAIPQFRDITNLNNDSNSKAPFINDASAITIEPTYNILETPIKRSIEVDASDKYQKPPKKRIEDDKVVQSPSRVAVTTQKHKGSTEDVPMTNGSKNSKLSSLFEPPYPNKKSIADGSTTKPISVNGNNVIESSFPNVQSNLLESLDKNVNEIREPNDDRTSTSTTSGFSKPKSKAKGEKKMTSPNTPKSCNVTLQALLRAKIEQTRKPDIGCDKVASNKGKPNKRKIQPLFSLTPEKRQKSSSSYDSCSESPRQGLSQVGVSKSQLAQEYSNFFKSLPIQSGPFNLDGLVSLEDAVAFHSALSLSLVQRLQAIKQNLLNQRNLPYVQHNSESISNVSMSEPPMSSQDTVASMNKISPLFPQNPSSIQGSFSVSTMKSSSKLKSTSTTRSFTVTANPVEKRGEEASVPRHVTKNHEISAPMETTQRIYNTSIVPPASSQSSVGGRMTPPPSPKRNLDSIELEIEASAVSPENLIPVEPPLPSELTKSHTISKSGYRFENAITGETGRSVEIARLTNASKASGKMFTQRRESKNVRKEQEFGLDSSPTSAKVVVHKPQMMDSVTQPSSRYLKSSQVLYDGGSKSGLEKEPSMAKSLNTTPKTGELEPGQSLNATEGVRCQTLGTLEHTSMTSVNSDNVGIIGLTSEAPNEIIDLTSEIPRMKLAESNENEDTVQPLNESSNIDGRLSLDMTVSKHSLMLNSTSVNQRQESSLIVDLSDFQQTSTSMEPTVKLRRGSFGGLLSSPIKHLERNDQTQTRDKRLSASITTPSKTKLGKEFRAVPSSTLPSAKKVPIYRKSSPESDTRSGVEKTLAWDEQPLRRLTRSTNERAEFYFISEHTNKMARLPEVSTAIHLVKNHLVDPDEDQDNRNTYDMDTEGECSGDEINESQEQYEHRPLEMVKNTPEILHSRRQEYDQRRTEFTTNGKIQISSNSLRILLSDTEDDV